VYGTAEEPTITNATKKVVSGSGRGTFTTTLTNLTGANFYVRAYATQNDETVYGNQVSFKLNVPYTELSEGLMVQNTNISNSGVNWSSANSLCNNSTIGNFTDWRLPTRDELVTVYTNRAEIGIFSTYDYYWTSTSFTNSGTTYYYFVDFSDGHSNYGDIPSSVNLARCVRKNVNPEVSVLAASNVSNSGATLNGQIINEGSNGYSECGFVYGTTSNPTVSNTKVVSTTAATDSVFTAAISGLPTGNIYFVRAYVTDNANQVYYSATEVQFSTANQLPSVSTLPVTNLAAEGARLNGSIVTKGIPDYTEKGFVYSSTLPEPEVEDDGAGATKRSITGTAIGNFGTNVTGLTTGTTYYVRAYATNTEGTAYGTAISFIPADPNYVTLPVAGLMIQKTDIGTNTWSSINSLCENSIVAGYTDWRLPTQSELATMYNERNTIGGFTTTYSGSSYWSSSSYYTGGYTYYYYQFFYDGSQSYSRNGSYNGRCVRTLP
jgi:hypothetical protein